MPYVVKHSAARMPASCKGRYRHVAVMEVAEGVEPAMISTRARGVLRIVERWDRRFAGTSARCAFRRALAEAESLARQLNA